MLYDPDKDPVKEIESLALAVKRRDVGAQPAMDDKELGEREDAAQRYAGENERHFVDYLMDCVKQSTESMREIRKTWAECYSTYKENEPVNYRKKADWQSRIVVPKPFGTVQYGAAAIKKAFSPNYLTIEDPRNPKAAAFWQRVMEFQTNEQHAKFVTRFTDATRMGLAVGQSMEMLPRWIPGAGLRYVLTEPWKIHRDPDALSRDCQSGIYWIHQEWLDYFALLEGEKKGRYFDVARAKDTASSTTNDEFMTPEAIAARKKMIYERGSFRSLILTSEFWGIVLSPKGEVLLPSANYTVAADRVIQLPKAVPYKKIRWPGFSFSPIPDLLTSGGRGLLEGVISVWEAWCNIMCLHQDNLAWIVNPMTEITVDALVDPADAETWPGKEYLVRETLNGQQVVRSVQRPRTTNEVLANSQHYDQLFQRGSMVSDAVQGLPGYRKDMTYREFQSLLDQGLGVFSLMGDDIEQGAIESLIGGTEMIEAHATYADYRQIFSEDELAEFGIVPDEQSRNGVAGVPPFTGAMRVTGLQALMKDNDMLLNLKQVIIPLAMRNSRFQRYIKAYPTLKLLIERMKLEDKGIICDSKEAEMIEAGEYEELAIQKKAALDQQELAEAQAMAKIAESMDKAKASGGSR
jgi:hypothetical protein